MNDYRSEGFQAIAEIEAAIAAYKHPGEELEEPVKADLASELAKVLTPVLQYIANGRQTRRNLTCGH